MKNLTVLQFFLVAYFYDRYAVSRATWCRLSQTLGFPEPVRIGRAVRWSVRKVDVFFGGDA